MLGRHQGCSHAGVCRTATEGSATHVMARQNKHAECGCGPSSTRPLHRGRAGNAVASARRATTQPENPQDRGTTPTKHQQRTRWWDPDVRENIVYELTEQRVPSKMSAANGPSPLQHHLLARHNARVWPHEEHSTTNKKIGTWGWTKGVPAGGPWWCDAQRSKGTRKMRRAGTQRRWTMSRPQRLQNQAALGNVHKDTTFCMRSLAHVRSLARQHRRREAVVDLPCCRCCHVCVGARDRITAREKGAGQHRTM